MATPPYPDPVAPMLASPLYDAPEGSRCGDTFAETVEVRNPYRGIDEFAQELPRIWHMVPNITRPSTSLEDRIGSAIEDTTVVLDAYRESGEVDENNYEALDEILDTAAEYLAYCRAVRKEWTERSLVYRGSGDVDEDEARSWLRLSLNAELPDVLRQCESPQQAPGYVVRLDFSFGGYVEYECPGLGVATLYRGAWDQYLDTIEKAARQARCAQEGLYSLVAYRVNRRLAEARPPSPGRVLRAPAPTPLGPPRPPIPPAGIPGSQPPMVPPPPPTEPGWSTGKKVALGAIVVGGLVGVGWLVNRMTEPRKIRVTNWNYPEAT